METPIITRTKAISAAIAIVILVVVGFVYLRSSARIAFISGTTSTDQPPDITFTWIPIERAYVEQVRGRLVITDDRGIDFSTLSMRVVEANRTLDLGIPGLLGREYGVDLSFNQFATNGDILRKGEMTLEFRVADTAGQETVVTKVVKVRNDHLLSDAEAQRMMQGISQ